LIDDTDSDALLPEIILSNDSGDLVVLVEGDLDVAYISEVALPSACVVNGRGKPRILAELDAILDSQIPVLVLLDRDFDETTGVARDHPDVFYTRRYNLEAELLLDEEVFGEIWHLNLRATHRNSIDAAAALKICEDVATRIGHVRFLSVTHGLYLNLERFPIERVVQPSTPVAEIECDHEAIIHLALARSPSSPWLRRRKRRMADGHLARAAKRIGKYLNDAPEIPAIEYASGHDVGRVLNYLLSRLRQRGVPSASELEWQALHEARKSNGGSLARRLASRAREHGYEVAATPVDG
jgi:hypothetical protein